MSDHDQGAAGQARDRIWGDALPPPGPGGDAGAHLPPFAGPEYDAFVSEAWAAAEAWAAGNVADKEKK